MTAYICNTGALLSGEPGNSTVSVINTVTYEVIATVNVGSNPGWIAVAPDGAHVYVTNRYGDATSPSNNGTVSVIDVLANNVTATVPVGQEPFGVALTPDGAYVYVANSLDGTVSVIATATNKVVTTVTGFTTPMGVAAPVGGSVYVTDLGNPEEASPGFVWVFKTDTNAGPVRVQGNFVSPQCVAASTNGDFIYVTDAGVFDTPESAIWVIRGIDPAVIATIKVQGGGGYNAGSPAPIAVSPTGPYVYVVTAWDPVAVLSWISAATNEVVNTTTLTPLNQPVPSGLVFAPTGVSVTPDGAYIYVVSAGSDSVSVIDTAMNQVVETIMVGAYPSALGQFLAFMACPIQNLFEDDAAAVEQMRRVRDEQLSAPAGAFLSEVLARHSADLIGMLADHPELRDESRELLLEAARVAQEGARFDGELIDRAGRLVSRAEVLLPSSMSGIRDATRTILASLRERTLTAGIAKASETITPRFPPSHLPPSEPDAS